MNPQLTYELDFSFFKSFFSFSNDEKDKEKNKKEKKEKKEKNKENKEKNENKENKEKKETNEAKKKQNTESQKSSLKQNISKKDPNKSSEAEYPEDDNNKSIKKNINEKEDKITKEMFKSEKKEEKKEINFISIEDIEDTKFEETKEEENNIIKGKKRNSIKKNKKENKTKTKNKDELLNFLINYIKNVYIFRKKVNNLIKKQKENYVIISSINKNNLTMHIFVNEEKIKKLKYTYEPILNLNIFYIPRKNYKKKNLLKFSFVNSKNETIIDPKFNTEYDDGEFINVINLKKIKDKEEEKEEEFQSFLENYYTLKTAISKEIAETNKLSLGVVRIKKKHKTMDNKGGLVFGGHINSILKQRPIKRVASNRKICFSEKNETISYKKDD